MYAHPIKYTPLRQAAIAKCRLEIDVVKHLQSFAKKVLASQHEYLDVLEGRNVCKKESESENEILVESDSEKVAPQKKKKKKKAASPEEKKTKKKKKSKTKNIKKKTKSKEENEEKHEEQKEDKEKSASPKRPKKFAAYHVYLKEQYKLLHEKDPDKNFRELVGLIGIEWKRGVPEEVRQACQRKAEKMNRNSVLEVNGKKKRKKKRSLRELKKEEEDIDFQHAHTTANESEEKQLHEDDHEVAMASVPQKKQRKS